jgi:hypothetical protein
MLNSHPFLFESIGVNNLGSLSLWAHLKLAWEFLPLVEVTCVPLFKQLIERGIYQLHENISEILYDHFFLGIIFNLLSNSH